MVQDLLDLCSLDAGRLELHRRPTELRTLLERIIERVIPTIPSRAHMRSELADNASERRVSFEIRSGTAARPLEIHTYDLGPRGMFVVGLNRRAR